MSESQVTDIPQPCGSRACAQGWLQQWSHTASHIGAPSEQKLQEGSARAPRFNPLAPAHAVPEPFSHPFVSDSRGEFVKSQIILTCWVLFVGTERLLLVLIPKCTSIALRCAFHCQGPKTAIGRCVLLRIQRKHSTIQEWEYRMEHKTSVPNKIKTSLSWLKKTDKKELNDKISFTPNNTADTENGLLN